MRVKLASTDTVVKLAIFLLVMFVTVGDVILPEPLRSASKNTKTTINTFIIGLTPKDKFTNPNERTEKAVDEFEQGTGTK